MGQMCIYLHADNAKVKYKVATSTEDQECLQKVINKMKEWCVTYYVKDEINSEYHFNDD